MQKYIDLHTHSVMSDGSMTPEQVVCHAKESGLAAVALSDHDSIEGVARAMAEGERVGIEVVPAIEFSVKSETETHILAYYIDIESEILNSTLEAVRQVRCQRNLESCNKLIELGFDVSMEEALALAPNGIVGRAHFAKLLADKGYVASVKEGFRLWLDNGRPAYSGTQYLSAADAVELTKKAKGLSFVAHLHLIHKSDEELFDFLKELKSKGLCGIEGYYTDYTPEMQSKYQSMAKELGLIISGGTDFHAEMKPHISIGTGLGNMRIPYSVLDNIKSAYRKEYENEKI